MKTYNLAFLGFGNVGHALVQLLQSKRGELREKYGVEFALTGVASRRLGWHANAAGFPNSELLQGGSGLQTPTGPVRAPASRQAYRRDAGALARLARRQPGRRAV